MIQSSEGRYKTLWRVAPVVRCASGAYRRRSVDQVPRFVQSRARRNGVPSASIHVSDLDHTPGPRSRGIADPFLLGSAQNVVDGSRGLCVCFFDALERRCAPRFFDPHARVDVGSVHVAPADRRVPQFVDRDRSPAVFPTRFVTTFPNDVSRCRKPSWSQRYYALPNGRASLAAPNLCSVKPIPSRVR
jgi:hypothetical protein